MRLSRRLGERDSRSEPLDEGHTRDAPRAYRLARGSGGLETDLGLLRSMGIRGVCIAFAGSLCGPFLLGIGFSKALGGSTKEALAVGASLSPTSLACALTALRAERVLNTPVGQAVLAAGE